MFFFANDLYDYLAIVRFNTSLPLAIMATNITFHPGHVSYTERSQLLSVRTGATLWLTGLSASGKSTIATALEQTLLQRGLHAYRLDGDNIRFGLNKDLGFSQKDREENIRRIGEVRCSLSASVPY